MFQSIMHIMTEGREDPLSLSVKDCNFMIFQAS